jgi:hypothetical protein
LIEHFFVLISLVWLLIFFHLLTRQGTKKRDPKQSESQKVNEEAPTSKANSASTSFDFGVSEFIPSMEVPAMGMPSMGMPSPFSEQMTEETPIETTSPEVGSADATRDATPSKGGISLTKSEVAAPTLPTEATTFAKAQLPSPSRDVPLGTSMDSSGPSATKAATRLDESSPAAATAARGRSQGRNGGADGRGAGSRSRLKPRTIKAAGGVGGTPPKGGQPNE